MLPTLLIWILVVGPVALVAFSLIRTASRLLRGEIAAEAGGSWGKQLGRSKRRKRRVDPS